jgi:hypothetical protein
MNRLPSAVRRCLRAALPLGLATIIASVSAPTRAVASETHSVTIRGTAECDHDAREWVITWTLTNDSDNAGTVGNVRAYPAGRALVGLPRRVQPQETISAVQRTLASEYTASIVLDINWDDGDVTYNHNWPVYIYSSCA